MYQGIDLSRFKKIAGNDKVSTLRHSKGHEIKIAHSSLSPEMREHLANLPVHMAEGGDPMAIDPESPTEADDAAFAEAIPPKPEVMPNAGTIDVVAPRRQAAPTTQDLDNEAAAYADDVQRGYIKPETMASLFAKKDTVGKIGTIFGLLVGGAGAGLTHQPNALLGMMQKEIDNDLEAQKMSNSNAQNWLRLSHEHEMQQANVSKTGAETMESLGRASKVPAETSEIEARAASHRGDAELKAIDAAKTRMQISILHQLTGTVNNMPAGPAKQAALDTLNNTITPSVMEDIKKRNAQTAGKLNLRAGVRGDLRQQDPQDENGMGVDFEKLNKLAQLGVVSGDMHLPGGMDKADVAHAREEAQRVMDNRLAAKAYNDSFNRLDQAFAAGKLNPQFRQAEIATLGAELARATAGRFNADEAAAQADGMFPSPKDYGAARDEKHRKAIQFFQKAEGSTPTLDQFKLKTTFPTYVRERKTKKPGAGKEAKTSGPKEGATGTYAGKPVVFRGGKWVAQ